LIRIQEVSNCVRGTLNPTMLEILTNTDQQRVRVHVVIGTGELSLYFTVYYGVIHNGGRVYTLTEAIKEIIWLQGLLDDLEIEHEFLKIHCDSLSAIYLAKYRVYHAQTKHIDARFHSVREILDEGDIELKKMITKDNFADMLTKVDTRTKFNYPKNLLRTSQAH